MTIPEPIWIIYTAAVLGVVAAIMQLTRGRVRILGAFVLWLAVVNLGAGIYLSLPMCHSAQVLAGGNVLRCSRFQWRPVIALMGAAAIVSGILALLALRRNLNRGQRFRRLIGAAITAIPGSFIFYGLTFVLLLVVSLGAGQLVRATPDQTAPAISTQ